GSVLNGLAAGFDSFCLLRLLTGTGLRKAGRAVDRLAVTWNERDCRLLAAVGADNLGDRLALKPHLFLALRTALNAAGWDVDESAFLEKCLLSGGPEKRFVAFAAG